MKKAILNLFKFNFYSLHLVELVGGVLADPIGVEHAQRPETTAGTTLEKKIIVKIIRILKILFHIVLYFSSPIFRSYSIQSGCVDYSKSFFYMYFHDLPNFHFFLI